MSKADYNKRNADIRAWGKGQLGPMRSEMRALGIRKYSGRMSRFLRDSYYQREGRIHGIGFKMPVHAVFVHKGVGRGYPIEAVGGRAAGLSRSRVKKQLESRFNKKATSRFLSNTEKLAPNPRKPKPWFNPIIDRSIGKLADTIAKHDADIAAQNVFIV